MKRISDARKKLNTEINRCKKDGYRILFVSDRKTADYIGMNDLAARSMGYPKLKKKTLEVDKNLTLKEQHAVLRHERIERELMSKKRWPYWRAHREALRRE